MTTIYWNFYPYPNGENMLDLVGIEPTPLLPELAKTRNALDDNHYMKCPAFQDYYKNTYVIRCPMDITISYDKQRNFLSIYPQNQNIYDNFIRPRITAAGKDDPFLLSFALLHLFIADKSCMIEQLPANLHTSDFLSRTNVVPGTFDIAKWFRPIEFAFEVSDFTEPLKLKRGDVLFYFRFIPSDGGKVELKQTEFDESTINITKRCLALKDIQPKQVLDFLYTIATKYKNKLWFNKNKCPFNWRKK
jgi:hypothetical protein